MKASQAESKRFHSCFCVKLILYRLIYNYIFKSVCCLTERVAAFVSSDVNIVQYQFFSCICSQLSRTPRVQLYISLCYSVNSVCLNLENKTWFIKGVRWKQASNLERDLPANYHRLVVLFIV